MGYTHYWNQSRPFTNEEWATIQTKAKQIIDIAQKSGIHLGNGYGEGKPSVTASQIWLNGMGELGHETFFLEKTPKVESFTFCKTAQKPYDAVVVSILAVARDVSNAIGVSSDGGPEAIKNVFNLA